MYNKLGRGAGAGRGGGKRSLPPPPPSGLHRPAAAGARLPIGGPGARNRPGAAGAVAPPAREETFSLVPGEPDFGAIIRLTPDIIEEIRRVEAQGGSARIKFDSNSNNPGNVIEVGGKEFKFTWARELGDLCDIYEERRSGEDGHGLLAECGSAWRKINVQRILDESTKNHVKMRSEEAERLLKSRKAIILGSDIPSVKNQVKSMAASGVDGSNRRMNWTRKEPPAKKWKVESRQVPLSGPSKPASKSAIASNIATKSRLSVSPLSSPHGQPELRTSVSPFGTENSSNPEDIFDPFNLNKEEDGNLEKEMPSNVVHGAVHEVIGQKWAIGDHQRDLRSILITLLSKNPKGMTLMGLEKSVGEAIPNSAMKIKSVIKSIATFQAPGRYFLKPGIEVETSKRRASESGSSPEIAHDQTPPSESIFLEKAASEKNEQQSQLSPKVDDESDAFEKIESIQNDPASFTSDRKVDNDKEEKAGSSSGTGSDSDSESDSSDSESDSRSKSRSRSRSPSSSDSESDGSASSKEGSDVEVEIMTSDEEAEHKNGASELKIQPSPTAFPASLDEHENIDILGNDREGQDGSPSLDLNDLGRGTNVINAVEVTDDFPINSNIQGSENSKVPLSPDHYKQIEAGQSVQKKIDDPSRRGVYQNKDEIQTMMKDSYVNGASEVSERIPKSKSKRAFDSGNFQEKPESAKRAKAGSSARTISSTSPENSHYITADRSKQDLHKDQMVKRANKAKPERSGVSKSACRTPPSSDFWNGPILDTEQSEPKTSEPNGRRKILDSMEKSGRYVDMPIEDKFSLPRDKSHKGMPDGNGDASEKYPLKNVRESSGGGKLSSTPDSYKRKYGENFGSSKENGELSRMYKSDINDSSSVSRKGGMLTREFSDLELGEFREEEVTGGANQQFDRKGSFKSSDINTDNVNLDASKGRSAANALASKKQSPSSLRVGIHGSQDGLNRRDDPKDSTRPQQRAIPSQTQQFSRSDHTDTEPRAQGMDLENHAGAHRKIPAGTLPQNNNKQDGRTSIKTARISKPQRPSASRDSVDRSKNGILMENGNNGRKKRDSSSDEDNSYSKYDKDKAELKGPIKDLSQWKEYVQEYREKHGIYCSLNKNIENTQNDFLKIGSDLEDAKERDMEEYYILVEELKEMYNQHGDRHKQMKKIFVLLHDELKNLKQRIKEFAQTHS